MGYKIGGGDSLYIRYYCITYYRYSSMVRSIALSAGVGWCLIVTGLLIHPRVEDSVIFQRRR